MATTMSDQRPAYIQRLEELLIENKLRAVRAEYSGGNDSGWISVYVYPSSVQIGPDFEWVDDSVRQEIDVYGAIDTSEIVQIITAPIDDRFGNFDGDPECEGAISFQIGDEELDKYGTETAWIDSWD